ncbi:MAG TPA: ribosome assembly RNA-binding protein YhbY [Deltaproteobacteria bacterium]|jgi:RNA-binding protein|nr:ribosome assembly RNA-binding protein YhbY [Deltaproteobacteria bacterium]HIF68587.1 ribosome assembly RNA-binding protein YhbY [Candidatus Lambdaproteobacteria bacterium]
MRGFSVRALQNLTKNHTPDPSMTGQQKRYLRGLAHALKPVVNIGKSGLTDEAFKQIEARLLTNELIKVKVMEHSPFSQKECAAKLDGREEVAVVQVIGKTIVLYRPHLEEPMITLPGE